MNDDVPMHAIVIREPGGPEVLVWSEVPDPRPGPGEVVVDIVASAVNRADLLQRLGFYDPPPGTPPYPGLECSGRISVLGEDVTGWRVGDEVCALLAGGGYAERVAVPVGQIMPVPVGLVESAALPEVACTVWSNLVDVARLRVGETLLVHGGGSGIGTFAIQFAKALGARVVTTARRAKHETLTALRARPPHEKAHIVAGVLADVWPLLKLGAIRPVIDRTVPMPDAAHAHEVVASNAHTGKVLLVTPAPAPR